MKRRIAQRRQLVASAVAACRKTSEATDLQKKGLARDRQAFEDCVINHIHDHAPALYPPNLIRAALRAAKTAGSVLQNRKRRR